MFFFLPYLIRIRITMKVLFHNVVRSNSKNPSFLSLPFSLFSFPYLFPVLFLSFFQSYYYLSSVHFLITFFLLVPSFFYSLFIVDFFTIKIRRYKIIINTYLLNVVSCKYFLWACVFEMQRMKNECLLSIAIINRQHCCPCIYLNTIIIIKWISSFYNI